MDLFESHREINDLLSLGNANDARNKLIILLDHYEKAGLAYEPVVNYFIRETGLFPYMSLTTAGWQEKYVHEAFKADVGLDSPVTLHREQSFLLSQLLSGKNIAVSAPTSFGKSFVIDAFISIKKPKIVVIIVPTIALTDETRRRLQKKFGSQYKVITTADQIIPERAILIFPQERAVGYAKVLENIDMLVVDEFYKASNKFDPERSTALIRAMLKLGKISRQKYFLAPNISEITSTFLTDDVEFCHLDFNTVFLKKHPLYVDVGRDEGKKSDVLVRILNEYRGKTLIYAGTYSNITKVANLLIETFPRLENRLLADCSNWLHKNYARNWYLASLIERGVGVHNGQLHRSLSQIQIRLFEEDVGLSVMVSTSSIIEGVNTSAENVVLWSNLSGRGRAKIKDFTYKNIIGRGGRMFKHFVGNIFILEEPPREAETELDLSFPDDLVFDIDDVVIERDLTNEQFERVANFNREMKDLLGHSGFQSLLLDGSMQTNDARVILAFCKELRLNSESWRGIGYLNSENPENWDRMLYKVIGLNPSGWGIEHSKVVQFVKVISRNWSSSIPEMLEDLSDYDIGIDDFFKLERLVTFRLSALLNDLNNIQFRIPEFDAQDISSFTTKLAHAFLPTVVYQLEEYGLPRMISRKIHNSGWLNLEDDTLNIHSTLDIFRELPLELIYSGAVGLEPFEQYIFRYFHEGIV